MAEEKGVWRTIRGRRVFIRSGEDLESAMKRSGKFKMKITEEEKQNIEKNKYKDDRDTTNEEFIRDEIKQFIDGGNEKESFINFRDRMKETYGVEEDTFNKRFQHAEDNLYYEKTGQLPTEERKKTYSREARAREIDKANKMSKEDYLEISKDWDEQLQRNPNSEFFKSQRDTWLQKYDEAVEREIDKINNNNKYVTENEPKDELKEISGGAISTLQTTTPRSKAERLKPGAEIYYKGDQANTPGYFTVEKFEPEKEQFLASITLKEKGGEGRIKKIGSQQIEDSYTNNYASRFAFKEDYDNYRNQVFENYRKIAEDAKNTTEEQVERFKERKDTEGDSYSDALNKIKKDLSRPYVEQSDGTYADPKNPFTKRTSSELRKQIKELEPYTEELQVGNRVIINTGGGRYGVRNVGDEDDPMTDYSAYVYGFNAKSIIQRAREQGIVTDAPKASKTTEAQVERFKERKGKSNSIENLSKRELAEKLVENQISRGMSFNNKENVINSKMKMTKEELLKYFK